MRNEPPDEFRMIVTPIDTPHRWNTGDVFAVVAAVVAVVWGVVFLYLVWQRNN